MAEISKPDVRLIVRLLGQLQTCLEAAIDRKRGEIEEPWPKRDIVREAWLKKDIAVDRKDWRSAEDLILRLTELKKTCPRPLDASPIAHRRKG
jgi:hypothetical protein